MGKETFSASSHLRHYVSEFRDVFTFDGEVLFRQAYGKPTVLQKRSQVTQHLRWSKHTAAVVGLKINQAHSL
jgi:hypothetical protein